MQYWPDWGGPRRNISVGFESLQIPLAQAQLTKVAGRKVGPDETRMNEVYQLKVRVNSVS